MNKGTEIETVAAADHPDAPHRGKYDIDLSGAQWRISSHSSGSGSCVELAALEAGHVAVRDSTDRSRPALVFDAAEWRAFVAAMADGQFADLG
jgi:hypothetical protein